MAELSNTCYKWDNHHGALVSLLDGLLQRERLVDVTLAAEGHFINVHQIVLFASSKYFEDLLSQPHKPAVVFLKGVKFSTLTYLIDYMYKGEVSLPEDQLDTFFETAKSLQIIGLPYESQPSQVEYSEPVLLEKSQNQETGGPIIDPDSVVSLREPEIQTDQDTSMIQIDEENFPFNQEGTAADLLQQQDQDLLESTAAPYEVDQDLEVLSDECEQHPAPIVFKQNQEEMVERDEAIAADDDDIISNASIDEDLLHSDWSDEEEDSRSTKSNRSSTRRLKGAKGKANSNQTSAHPAFKCDPCGRDFQNQFLLKKHALKGGCQLVPYFRCGLCGTSISNRNHVKRHLSRLHKSVKSSQFDDYIVEVGPTLTCSVCSHRSKDLASLQQHKKKKHDGGN